MAAILTSAGRVQGAVAPAEHVRIAGQDYVRLADWAKDNRLEGTWVKPDETLLLTNHSTRLVLAVDHREAQVNGIQVWLLFPVVVCNKIPYITRLDLQATLLPILYPPKNPSRARVRTICLDPGHGGKDTGYMIGSNAEKTYTLLLAQELRKQLSQAGFKVFLTRSTDEFVELPARPETARRKKADLMVSLHFNATDGARESAQGAEVYCLTPAGASSTNARGEGGGEGAFPGNHCNDRSLFLAYELQSALSRGLGVEDRGVRRARFAVLRDAVMPATLIEAGFMSHPIEGRKIFTAAYRQKLARAIVEGVVAYKRQVERP
ncbi:MAG TPA: N-acetylmuramoyl-L-alanine amidase [Candidatus Acidoferrum sp.]|nr:N-acetylmuramoyl-L-alanine amidase [Candidatus Acidoferrum sp.]